MVLNQKRSPACPLCRRGNRKCLRGASEDCCRHCKTSVGLSDQATNFNQFSEHPFEELFQETVENPPLTEQQEGYTISRNVEISFSFSGRFASENADLIAALNAVIYDKFATQLRNKFGGSAEIKNASLLGGYLHFLFSTGDLRSWVKIHGPDDQGTDLVSSLRRILVFQIRVLVDGVLAAARDDDRLNIFTYAAAAILHEQVASFRSSLRLGDLSKQAPGGLAGPFTSWFSSLELQLRKLIVQGCGRFPHWLSVVDGSINLLPRKYECLSVSVILEQQIDEEELQLAPLTEYCHDVALMEHPGPVQLVPQIQGTEFSHLGRHFDADGDEILGATSRVGGCSTHQRKSNVSPFHQDLDPLLLHSARSNWKPQFSMPNRVEMSSSATADATIFELSEPLDPSLCMADVMMSNTFDNGGFQSDFGLSFDSYETNFGLHETLPAESDAEPSKFEDENFDTTSICFNGSNGHPFTSA